jgi:NAD(P)-dependent dehydrogenase (short-subunit alcohol dehydrogenase family)
VSIITRCNDGLGWAIAQRLSQRGDDLVISDDNWPALQKIGAELQIQDGSVLALQAESPLDEAGAQRVAEAAVDRFGRIDVLINGLHRLPMVMAMEQPSGIGIGADEVMFTIDAVVPHMRAAGGGQIVNLISAAGRYRSSYLRMDGEEESGARQAGTDGAIFALTRQLGFELARDRIRVNAVSVGWIRSNRQKFSGTRWLHATGPFFSKKFRSAASASPMRSRVWSSSSQARRAVTSLATRST